MGSLRQRGCRRVVRGADHRDGGGRGWGGWGRDRRSIAEWEANIVIRKSARESAGEREEGRVRKR
jgi:hypothetical protein